MPGNAMGHAPRIVGVAGDGGGGESGAFALALATAMDARSARVAVAAVDPARRLVLEASRAAGVGTIRALPLPAPAERNVWGREAVRVAIEGVGRDVDRIVLDLGAATSDDATFFGAAVDDLIVYVAARDGAGGAAAGLVERLGRRGARSEVLLVAAGPSGADVSAATFRLVGGPGIAVRPRLVPLGLAPLPAELQAPTRDGAAALDRIARALLRPRPMPIRGGLQFFLEDRAEEGRAA